MGDSFTIQISSNLVNRLVGDEDKVKKKTRKPKPKISHEPQQPQSKVKPASGTQKSSSGREWPLQPPIFLPVPTPPLPVEIAELQAIRSVLQESEEVLEKLDKQEADMLQELTQRAKELHAKEFKLPYQKAMPCIAEREACLQCYKENLKEPLKCALVVKAFDDCARRARQQASSISHK